MTRAVSAAASAKTAGSTTSLTSRQKTCTPSSKLSAPARSRCLRAVAGRSPRLLSWRHIPTTSPSWWHTSHRWCRCFRMRKSTERAVAQFRDAYVAKGQGAGMAAFIAMTSWRGEFTEEYFARPAPDPAQFGMTTEDDGSRDDPLLSDRSAAVTSYRPDFDALRASPTRIVIGVGEEFDGHLHWSHVRRYGRTTWSEDDGLPQPPRGFRGWGLRLCRPARSLRPQTARCLDRVRVMACLVKCSDMIIWVLREGD